MIRRLLSPVAAGTLLYLLTIPIASEFVQAQTQTTAYHGLMTVTKVDVDGEDQTPEAGKNILPVRFSLEVDAQNQTTLSASFENTFFAGFAGIISTSDVDTLVFTRTEGGSTITLRLKPSGSGFDGDYSLSISESGFSSLITGSLQMAIETSAGPINGIFAGIQRLGDISGDEELVEVVNTSRNLRIGLVQSGGTASVIAISDPVSQSPIGHLINQIRQPEQMTRSLLKAPSGFDDNTFIVLGALIGIGTSTTAVFEIDDTTIDGMDDDPIENATDRQEYTASGDNITGLSVINYEKLAETAGDIDSSVTINIHYDGVRMDGESLVFTAVTPHPNDGFPEVKQDMTVDFTAVSVSYNLVSDTRATVFLKAYANFDRNMILGETQMDIVTVPGNTFGTVTFPLLTAVNVTEQVLSISLIAQMKPENASVFTAESVPLVYQHTGDQIEIAMTDPTNEEPLRANRSKTIKADINFDLITAETGTIELNVESQFGDPVVNPTSIAVTNQQTSTELEITFLVPDHLNSVFVDALLISASGEQTLSSPPIEFPINRVRFKSVDPPAEEALESEQERSFVAQIDYNLATDTESGAIFLDLYDGTGQLLIAPPDVTTNKVFNLSKGAAEIQLSTRIEIPTETPRLKLIATLVDIQLGLPFILAEDTLSYRVGLKGRVTILGSNPNVPLSLAEIEAVDGSGAIVDDDKSSPEGVYQLFLEPGDYTIRARPEPADDDIRKEKEIPFTLDEDTKTLPDIELGVVNRGPQAQADANALSTIGDPQVLGRSVAGTAGIPKLGFANGADLVTDYVAGQPSTPDPTGEGLFRLHLATRATKQMTDGAEEISADLSATIAELFGALANLGRLNQLVGKTVTGILNNFPPTNRLIRGLWRLVNPDAKKLTDLVNDAVGAKGGWNPINLLFDRIKRNLFYIVHPEARIFLNLPNNMFNIFIGHVVQNSALLSTPDGKVAGQGLEDFVKDKAVGELGQEILMAYYADQNKAILETSVSSASSFQPQNDRLRIDQTLVNAEISQSRSRTLAAVNSVNTSYRAITIDAAEASKDAMGSLAAIMGPLVAVPGLAPIAKVVETVSKGLEKTLGVIEQSLRVANFALLWPRLFSEIPAELTKAQNLAFQSQAQAIRSPAIIALDGGNQPISFGQTAVFLDLQDAANDFNSELASIRGMIEADQFEDALLDKFTDGLIPAGNSLESAISNAEFPLQTAFLPAYEQDSTFLDDYSLLADQSIGFAVFHTILFSDLASFFWEVAFVDSVSDANYIARKDSVVARINDLITRNNQLVSQVDLVGTTISNAGLLVASAVIEDVDLGSAAGPLVGIGSSPQEFTISASVRNLGQNAVDNLTAQIFVDDTLGLSVLSATDLSIASLSPNQATELSWNLRFSGPVEMAFLPVEIGLMPDTDAVIVPNNSLFFIPVLDSVDTDQDAMPDSYESANGLNVSVKDADGDLDQDNLNNLAEFLIDTDPQDPDTDDDGFTDGAEVAAGSDPFDPESIPSVNPAAPTFAGVSPQEALQGSASVTATITGSNFAPGATVAFSGSGITVSDVTFASMAELTVTLAIDISAPRGLRDITIINPDGLSVFAGNQFRVLSRLPAPQNLTAAAASGSQVLLSWEAPPADPPLLTQVHRQPDQPRPVFSTSRLTNERLAQRGQKRSMSKTDRDRDGSQNLKAASLRQDELFTGQSITRQIGQDEEQEFFITVPDDAYSLRFETSSSTGDPDLFVRFGSPPDIFNGFFDFVSENDAGTEEIIIIDDFTFPALQNGDWYVTVLGFSTANYTLTATFSKPGALVNGVPVSGSVVRDGFALFFIDVPADATTLTFATSNSTGDPDLFVRFGTPPDLASFDFDFSSENSAPTEEFMRIDGGTIPALQPGTWFVSVLGFEDSNFSLTAMHNGGAATGPDGYIVYRSTAPSPRDSGTLIASLGGDQTSFIDQPPPRQTHYYQVSAVWAGEESEPSNEADVITSVLQEETASLPTAYTLFQNYPNPFNPDTRITFDLPKSTQVRIEIFNALGQRVATVLDVVLSRGSHAVEWDGRRDDGSIANSGIYLFRLKTEEFEAIRKLMLLR